MGKKEKLEEIMIYTVGKGYISLKKYKIRSRFGNLNGKYQEEAYIEEYEGNVYAREISWQVLLFSHEFAKIAFGDNNLVEETALDVANKMKDAFGLTGDSKKVAKEIASKYSTLEKWKHHLQNAVISEDPIEYYYNFITSLKNI